MSEVTNYYSSSIPEEFQIDFEALKKAECEFQNARPNNADFIKDIIKHYNTNCPFFDGIETMFDIVKDKNGKALVQQVAYSNGQTVIVKKYEIQTVEKYQPRGHYNQNNTKRIFFGKPFDDNKLLESKLPIKISVFKDAETFDILHIAGIDDNRNPTTSFDLYSFLFFGTDHNSEYDAVINYYNSLQNPLANNQLITNPPSVYGAASWMSFDSALDLNLFGLKNLYLGVLNNEKINGLFAIRYTNDKHLITIAPSGTGKNRCVQIPNLLIYEKSVIVIDPKGENAAVTAKRRRDDGHNVLILNPFKTIESHFENEGFASAETGKFESACFNPLDALDSQGDNFVADVYSLCDALIEQNDKEPFWSNSARELLSGLIMHVCSSQELKEANKRNLIYVRELLTADVETFKKNIEAILILTDNKLPIAQKLNRFKTLHDEDKLNLSIISIAVTETNFLDDPSLAKNLSNNDIDFQKFRTEKTTLYIILPAKYLTIYAKWFKLIITSALNIFTQSPEGEKVLFMLDECSLLGRLNSLETAISYARGFGIQIWSFWQDIYQIYDIYGKRAESFLANTGVQQYFTPNEITTCKKISERLGDNTALVHSKTEVNQGALRSSNSLTESETKVPFMSSTELLGLAYGEQIIFLAGSKEAILAEKYDYKHSVFGKHSPNPYDRE